LNIYNPIFYYNGTNTWGKTCVIQPVFFPRESVLQFATIAGYCSWSIFCGKEDKFIFKGWQWVKLQPVKLLYWIIEIAWRRLRYQWPWKFRQLFKKNKYPF